MIRSILFFIFMIFLTTFCTAQDFGDVSEQEIQMKNFVKDPQADAVILYEKGEMRITLDFNLEKHVYRKIKILTEKGKKSADVNIYYWHEDEISHLNAVAHLPNGEEQELDDDNITTTETNHTNKITFHIPGAEIGSVIEYEYDLFSKYITNMEPWYFQHEDYTVFSTLDVIMPPGFAYNTYTTNFQTQNITSKSENILNPENPKKSAVDYTFAGRDLPGIKEEPYMDNVRDQYTKILFMLQSYKSQYSYYQLAKSWTDLSKWFNIYYRGFLKADTEQDPAVIERLKTISDPLEKAKALYNLVTFSIKTEDHNYIADKNFKDPQKVLQDKSGTPDEKTILLINLLRKEKLDANPVLISTVSHGKFNPDFRDDSQFNRLICELNIGIHKYFLYTGDKYSPFGYLTYETSVEKGLMLDGEKSSIINIDPLVSFNKALYNTTCSLSDTGLTGESDIIYEGLYGVHERDKIDGKNSEDLKKYVENKISEFSKEAVIDTFYYADVDSVNIPLKLHIKYSLPDYFATTANLVYFKAPLYTDIFKNPFVKESRLYSVDYQFKGIKQEKLEIKIPSGMQITDVPLGTGGSIKELSFSRLNTKKDKSIICERFFNIYNRHIPPQEYKTLKEIYDKMVATSKDQVVLTKTTAATTGK